ncbi:MAG TPA: VIT1/CCC1 transporter family protein [Gammaproteobacteria bacterium]|nr:VIT1/CCC1 transporter family protein [Gammaproteobacteria bacterium]
MPQHQEKHVASSDTLKDLVIGMSDGLTVPFALAAGLSGAVTSTGIIVTAGVAEIAAGAIAMALGGYLAAKTEAEHYQSEYKRETLEVEQVPHIEAAEVADILKEFGVAEEQVPVVVNAMQTQPKKWVDFMMRFELGLERPDPRRMVFSPLTIGLAYVFGGLIPLLPYIFIFSVHQALLTSMTVTLLALLVFGAVKGFFTGRKILRSGVQTMLIGAVAAACAFGIAKWVSH